MLTLHAPAALMTRRVAPLLVGVSLLGAGIAAGLVVGETHSPAPAAPGHTSTVRPVGNLVPSAREIHNFLAPGWGYTP